MKFQEVQGKSIRYRETNDCSVKAVSIVTGIAYAEVLLTFKFFGRKPRKRTPNEITLKVMDYYGFYLKLSRPTNFYNGREVQYTMRTIGQHLRKGKYLVFTRGHVAAIVDGKVVDWTEGRCHRVLYVLEVI